MSSNPITEHCSGTWTPDFAKARMAPKAVMSSKAIRAVKGRRRCNSSCVSLNPSSKLENGSRDSGRSTISLGSIGTLCSRATARTPRQRGSVSDNWRGPRMKPILRWPREKRCSSAAREPCALSTIRELIWSFFSSHPTMAVGMLLFSMSARTLMSRKSQLASTTKPSMRRSRSISR